MPKAAAPKPTSSTASAATRPFGGCCRRRARREMARPAVKVASSEVIAGIGRWRRALRDAGCFEFRPPEASTRIGGASKCSSAVAPHGAIRERRRRGSITSRRRPTSPEKAIHPACPSPRIEPLRRSPQSREPSEAVRQALAVSLRGCDELLPRDAMAAQAGALRGNRQAAAHQARPRSDRARPPSRPHGGAQQAAPAAGPRPSRDLPDRRLHRR